MLKLSPVNERIAELEKALQHERAVAAAERRHAELLKDALARAYRFTLSAPRPRQDERAGEMDQ